MKSTVLAQSPAALLRDRAGGSRMNNLELTSSRDAEGRLRLKVRRLHEIRHALSTWRAGGTAPRHAEAMAYSALIFGSLLVASLVAGRYGFHLNPALAAGMALAVWVAVMRLSTLPRTHAERLDQLLATYEPVSKDAYRALQTAVVKGGRLTEELVEQWLDVEYAALEDNGQWRMPLGSC
jgi:hypothetical protein